MRRSFSYPCDPKVRQRIRAKLVARQVSAWSSQVGQVSAWSSQVGQVSAWSSQVGIYEYTLSQINYNY